MGLIQKIKRDLAQSSHKKSEAREYINYVCQQTGWSFDEAKEKMDQAKADGFSYKYYVKRKIWAKTGAQLEQAKRNMKIRTDRNRAERDHVVEEVCKATGWPESKAREKIKEARVNCGSSFKDCYKFRLYERTPEEQRTFLTLKVSEALLFKYNKDSDAAKILLYKGRFAKKYDDLFHRSWFINRDLSYETFLEKTAGVEDLICKPTASTQGKGVVKIHCGGDTDKKALYDQITGMDRRMICEECIVQHPAIAAFNPTSVNTIRVLTIVDNDVCHHVYAGFRMGCGEVVDNFHAGGIIATVDVSTGITCMDAINLDGTHFSHHPKSGLPTLGFQIPHWDQVLSLTEEAALRMKGVGLVGWDVAVTEDGVCLIEGNAEASYHIIQLPYVDAGIGMRKIFTEFL